MPKVRVTNKIRKSKKSYSPILNQFLFDSLSVVQQKGIQREIDYIQGQAKDANEDPDKYGYYDRIFGDRYSQIIVDSQGNVFRKTNPRGVGDNTIYEYAKQTADGKFYSRSGGITRSFNYRKHRPYGTQYVLVDIQEVYNRTRKK